MIAHVMAWHDSGNDEYYALVDLEREGEHLTPYTAARGKRWIDSLTAQIEADYPGIEIRTTNCGEMDEPSFEAVRTKALFVDTKDAFAPGQK
jgi:hypothetical protein